MNLIYDYSKDRLEEFFTNNNMPKFRATQVIEALYRKLVSSFDEATNLGKDTKKILNENFSFSNLELVRTIESTDTVKFLFKLNDGNLIETVLMYQSYGHSVCVTSQVGCNMGCKFCASGVTKKIRNLTSGEMVLQVLTVERYLREKDLNVSHVVIMGIGEPFDNYDNVIEFIKIINEAKGLAIGARHITVSTCGVVPKIIEFSDFPLQVNSAISLHFASDDKRDKYMPINKKYKLDELFDALDIYYNKTNRRITFEYILLKGINDTIDDAEKLTKLVKRTNAYVNLIPYNKTMHDLDRTDEVTRDKFFDYLIKHKVNAVVRKEHGTKIDAACGQLRVNHDPKLIKKDTD